MIDAAEKIVRQAWIRWETFWFRPIPPHSYALLRILFGLLGLAALFGLTPIAEWWARGGFVPNAQAGNPRAELLRLGLGAIAGDFYFWALSLSFVAMTSGYRTTWSVTASFVGSFLQLKWNNLPLSSAHQVLVAVLFCLVWADLAALLAD